MAVTSGRGPAAPQRRAALDAAKKEEMLAVVIRNSVAYARLVDRLTVKHVRTISEAHAFVWRTVIQFYEKNKELPPQGALITALHQACADGDSLLNEDELKAVDEFVEYAFDDVSHGCNLARSVVHRQVATETVGQFVQECVAYEAHSAIVRDGTIPDDLPAILDSARAAWDSAGVISGVELGAPFQVGWDVSAGMQLTACGVPTLDAFMGGGWQSPEVNIFMGPYGSCKTLTCCHGVAELVQHAAEQYRDRRVVFTADGRPRRPVVVLVFTEKNRREYQNRLLSHIATVPWKKLTRMHSVSDLCQEALPAAVASTDIVIGTEYESREFSSAISFGVGFKNEYARVQAAIQVSNLHLLLVDGTDSGDSPYRLGAGGMPELATILKTHFRKHTDTYPISVWVDHISALADRQVAAMGGNPKDHLPVVLKQMPMQAGDLIAKPLGVPVMLFHQLTGQAQKKGTTAKFHHSEGAWSAEVGQYAEFAFVTGPADQDQYCVFECTKHRREPATPQRVVTVNGTFNRIVDRTDEVLVHGRDIVRRDAVGANATTDRLAGTIGGQALIDNYGSEA